MVLNEEKRTKLAEVLALREEATTGAGASTLPPNIAPAAPSLALSAPLKKTPKNLNFESSVCVFSLSVTCIRNAYLVILVVSLYIPFSVSTPLANCDLSLL